MNFNEGWEAMWMVRSPGGAYAGELVEKGLIGIGWGEANPEFASAKTPEEFYKIVRQNWPEYKDQQVINAGRQLYKFFREMKAGDEVLTYDSSQRIYHVGIVKGDVTNQSKFGGASGQLPVSRLEDPYCQR